MYSQSFTKIIIRLSIYLQDTLSDETNSFLDNRSQWMNEITSKLERLKVMERDLDLKKMELQERERILKERETKLRQQFHVAVRKCFLQKLYADIQPVIFWQLCKISFIAVGLSISVSACLLICYNREHRSPFSENQKCKK